MLLKYRPEDKAAKKEHLLNKAQADGAGKDAAAAKKPNVVKFGLKHVTYLIEQDKAQLVVIAHDVDPIELVVWLPALCRKLEIPYCIVKGKARLGSIMHKKTASVLCRTTVKYEDKMDFSKILEAIKYLQQWMSQIGRILAGSDIFFFLLIIGERTFGVLTKIDLMDKGTDVVDILEGRVYRLQYPWVGIVNRSQADINKNVVMMSARRKEWEFWANSPEYRHLANRMGSEYLAKMLSKGKLYMIMEISRGFDQIFIEHLDGLHPGGDKIYNVFDNHVLLLQSKVIDGLSNFLGLHLRPCRGLCRYSCCP